MKTTQNIFLSLTILTFLAMIGGALYEHIAVVPNWSAAPPRSLAMYQGEYGLDPALFWQSIHPVILILFIGSTVSNWKNGRRNLILIPFITYVTILIITAIYFVPELMAITTTTYSNDVNLELTARAKLWETLSLIRLFTLIVLAMVLLSANRKPTT